MERMNDEETGTAIAPRPNQTLRREFGGTSLAIGNAATEALIAKTRADVEARWIFAMRNPRNLDDVRQRMLRECKRNGFAQQAIYKIPMGGQTVEGLTIRFAEVAARCMGNMPVEVVTIFDSEGERIVRVTVTDLESNVTWSRDITVKKTVERKQLKRGQNPIGERVNSYGDRVFIVEASDDEVAVKEAAQVSKAARTGILRIIPGHLQDEMFDLCKAQMGAQAAKDPDGERVKILDAFATLNVMPSDLEMYLGHDTTKMSPAEVEALRPLFVAMRDGEVTWAAVMESKLAAANRTPAPAATSSTPAQAAAPAQETAPAQRKKGGAAALKDQLKQDAKPPEQPAPRATVDSVQAAIDKAQNAFDEATARAREKDAKRAQEQAQPPSTEPEIEDRTCASCGVPIEVLKTEPAGAKCYACRQA